MKISIKVKPNAKGRSVQEIGENQYLVKVKAPPKENRANKELVETLARHFNVPKSRISILTGLKSSKKAVVIEEN